VPVSFEGHLTNRKPDFMLQLFEESPFKMDSLFYMDPDLLVNASWKFFTDWLSCGVAVCEDVNSPLPVSSPQRIGWRREFAKFGILLQPKDSCYANGGFIGVSCENKDFLISWKQIQDCLWKIVGGADFSGFMGGQELECRSGLCNCFIRTDQDALNATLEASKNIPISFLGRQAMGFCSGDAILPHAIGSLKPWRRNIIIDALRGVPPRLVDKCFWGNVTTPIQLFHSHKCARKRIEILVASLIGRFYSKR